MQFLYGNHVLKSGLGRITEGTPAYTGVVRRLLSAVACSRCPITSFKQRKCFHACCLCGLWTSTADMQELAQLASVQHAWDNCWAVCCMQARNLVLIPTACQVVYSMTDVPLGFGTTAKSTTDARSMDPGSIVVRCC
jgi:hypothetical protein